MKIAIAAVVAVLALLNVAEAYAGLTAAVSAKSVVMTAKEAAAATLTAALLNDGDKVVAVVDLNATELRVNGKTVTDEALKKALKEVPAQKTLAAGEAVLVELPLGAFLKAPGLYRIAWKGAGFASNEARLLVKP